MKKSLLALSILIGSLSTSVLADYRITIHGSNGKIDLPQKSTPAFTSQTFTNCGQTGNTGPSLSQCTRAYSGTEVLKPTFNFNVINGIQEFTIPQQGIYKITAAGASGGRNDYGQTPGKGALMSGDFSLSSGETIKILVGQKGTVNSVKDRNSNGSGGGGSFVATVNNQPLIISSGGGGAGAGNFNDPTTSNGRTQTNGNTPSDSYAGNGGINGGGGGAALNGSAGDGTTPGGIGSNCTFGSSGGGGFYSRGGYDCNGTGHISGESFLNGGLGGSGSHALGGFGGGAGLYGLTSGGGGGGYSGGGGGSYGNGGGGGSYNTGSNQNNQAGVNLGNGYVTITFVK